jgi:lysozyme
MNVKPNYKLLAEIVTHFEGFYPIAYKDTGGVWTLGIGSTFNFAKDRKVREGDTISKVGAAHYLELEVANVVKQLNLYIKTPLNEHQATALVDYVYNRGISNFLKTKLDDLINANPNNPAIQAEFIGTGLWDRMGNKLWGLGRRLRAESHLYFTGELKFVWEKWK